MILQTDFNEIKHKVLTRTTNDFILLGYLCMLFVLTLARFILHRLGIDSGVFREVLLTAIASVPLCALLITTPKGKFKKYRPAFILYAAVLAIIAFTYVLVPSSRYFITRDNYGIVRVLRPDCAMFAFLFFFCVDDIEGLADDLQIYAYIYMIYLAVTELFPAMMAGGWSDVGPSGKIIYLSYSLSFGYSMLLPTLILLSSFIHSGNKIDLVFSAFGYWAIVTNGNRGAFLFFAGFTFLVAIDSIQRFSRKQRNYQYVNVAGFLVAFLVLKEPVVIFGLALYDRIILLDDREKRSAYIRYLVLGILAYLLIFNLIVPKIVTMVTKLIDPKAALEAEKLAQQGSRTQQMLKEGSFQSNNGRKAIWTRVIGAIRTGGVFGRGFMGDRPFVFPLHAIAYSHNIVLEMVCGYGIFGVAALIYIARDIIEMIFLCKDSRWKELYFIFLAVSGQLLLSMSFWYVFSFWAALALAYRYRNAHPEQMNLKSISRLFHCKA